MLDEFLYDLLVDVAWRYGGRNAPLPGGIPEDQRLEISRHPILDEVDGPLRRLGGGITFAVNASYQRPNSTMTSSCAVWRMVRSMGLPAAEVISRSR